MNYLLNQSILTTFLGAKAPLEIASVSESVSLSVCHKKFGSSSNPVNAQSDIARVTYRYNEVSRCWERYQGVSRGINMYHELSKFIKCIKGSEDYHIVSMVPIISSDVFET